MTDTSIHKAKRERSKAYPGAPLEDCVRYAAQIKKELGKGTHDRDSLAKAMGFETVSGAVSPKIAALVHFGILNRTQGGYELSEDSKRITDHIDEAERSAAIREAFSKPTLYQEILDKFGVGGVIPGQLATHLHRFHGITAAASASAAEIFLQSGRFAGVIDQENRITTTGSYQPTAGRSGEVRSIQPPESVSPSAPPSSVSSQQSPIPSGTIVPATAQRFEFAITQGRSVVLLVPSDLNPKDIMIIRKQIELLELQAGIESKDT